MQWALLWGRERFWKLAPLIFVLTWAGGYSFAKLGLPYAPPMKLLLLRYALAAAVLAPCLFLFKVSFPSSLIHWRSLIVTGFLIQGVYFGLAYLAMSNGVEAGTTALILSMQPILVAVLSPMVLGENVGGKVWLGLLSGLVGTTIVIAARHHISPGSWVGVILALGALLGITSATLYEKRAGVRTHPVVNGIVQYMVGLVCVVSLVLFMESPSVVWHMDLVISLAYLVIANSIVSISILMGLIQRGSAAGVSALFFLVPPLAMLIAWGVLGETLPSLVWPGLVLCMISIAVVTRAGAPSA